MSNNKGENDFDKIDGKSVRFQKDDPENERKSQYTQNRFVASEHQSHGISDRSDKTLLNVNADQRQGHVGGKVMKSLIENIPWRGGRKTLAKQIEFEYNSQRVYDDHKLFDNYEETYRMAQEN